MAKTIRVTLDVQSLAAAVKELKAYQQELEQKCRKLCERLASLGALRASMNFSQVAYTGDKYFNISVEESGGKYYLIANGETVLILEFGAGIKHGRGHPQAAEFGMGPGTYPGQKRALHPKGWWLPKAKGGGHTYGNQPARGMYDAAQEMRKEIERIAREVFSGD